MANNYELSSKQLSIFQDIFQSIKTSSYYLSDININLNLKNNYQNNNKDHVLVPMSSSPLVSPNLLKYYMELSSDLVLINNLRSDIKETYYKLENIVSIINKIVENTQFLNSSFITLNIEKDTLWKQYSIMNEYLSVYQEPKDIKSTIHDMKDHFITVNWEEFIKILSSIHTAIKKYNQYWDFKDIKIYREQYKDLLRKTLDIICQKFEFTMKKINLSSPNDSLSCFRQVSVGVQPLFRSLLEFPFISEIIHNYFLIIYDSYVSRRKELLEIYLSSFSYSNQTLPIFLRLSFNQFMSLIEDECLLFYDFFIKNSHPEIKIKLNEIYQCIARYFSEKWRQAIIKENKVNMIGQSCMNLQELPVNTLNVKEDCLPFIQETLQKVLADLQERMAFQTISNIHNLKPISQNEINHYLTHPHSIVPSFRQILSLLSLCHSSVNVDVYYKLTCEMLSKLLSNLHSASSSLLNENVDIFMISHLLVILQQASLDSFSHSKLVTTTNTFSFSSLLQQFTGMFSGNTSWRQLSLFSTQNIKPADRCKQVLTNHCDHYIQMMTEQIAGSLIEYLEYVSNKDSNYLSDTIHSIIEKLYTFPSQLEKLQQSLSERLPYESSVNTLYRPIQEKIDEYIQKLKNLIINSLPAQQDDLIEKIDQIYT